MSKETTTEHLFNEIRETFADSVSRPKSVSFFDGDVSDSVSSQFNRLFGRQKPVHHILGGGKSADVLLWRNKKISASVLTGATVVWVLFEWLNYHILGMVCFSLVIGMIVQFLWSNASGYFNRSRSDVPRLVLPEKFFVNFAVVIGAEVNRALKFFQDVSCGRNLKQFLVVTGSLFAAAVIGSWCNFLTVLYIGFIAAHTLPVVYERYDDQVDSFVFSAFDQFQHHYRKIDASVRSKIPKGKFNGRKFE